MKLSRTTMITLSRFHTIFALFAFCSTSPDSFLKFFSVPLTEAIPTNWTAHYNTNTIYDTILIVMPLIMFSYLQYY